MDARKKLSKRIRRILKIVCVLVTVTALVRFGDIDAYASAVSLPGSTYVLNERSNGYAYTQEQALAPTPDYYYQPYNLKFDTENHTISFDIMVDETYSQYVSRFDYVLNAGSSPTDPTEVGGETGMNTKVYDWGGNPSHFSSGGGTGSNAVQTFSNNIYSITIFASTFSEIKNTLSSTNPYIWIETCPAHNASSNSECNGGFSFNSATCIGEFSNIDDFNNAAVKNPHIHNWSVSAENDTIYAYCTAEDCPLGTNQNNQITLTLEAETTGYTDKPYTGAEILDKDGMWEKYVGNIPEINYYYSDGTEIYGCPVESGNYVAKISCIINNCTYTAEKEFSITYKSIVYVNGMDIADGGYWKNGDTDTCTGTEADYNAHYDAQTHTLTLNNAVISSTLYDGNLNSYCLILSNEDLIIDVIEDSRLVCSEISDHCGVKAGGDLKITGTNKELYISLADGCAEKTPFNLYGIYGDGKVVLDDTIYVRINLNGTGLNYGAIVSGGYYSGIAEDAVYAGTANNEQEWLGWAEDGSQIVDLFISGKSTWVDPVDVNEEIKFYGLETEKNLVNLNDDTMIEGESYDLLQMLTATDQGLQNLVREFAVLKLYDADDNEITDPVSQLSTGKYCVRLMNKMDIREEANKNDATKNLIVAWPENINPEAVLTVTGHNWVYSVSTDNSSLIARCDNPDDPTCEYATDGAVLTLKAESADYSESMVYAASMDTSAWDKAVITVPSSIKYYKADAKDSITGGEEITELTGLKPGYYYAAVTAGEGDDAVTAAVAFEISKISQQAPASGEGYTADYTAEILEASENYEISTDGKDAITGNNRIDMVPGTTYYVRKKGNDTAEPSEWTPVQTAKRPKAPEGYTVNTTDIVPGSYGEISDLDETVEYSIDGGETWTGVSGTSITGLSSGKVLIRVKATSEAPVGTPAQITFYDAHVHDFSLQTVSPEYLCSAATCTSPTKYYYVCECGEHGIETFDYGDLRPHAYIYFATKIEATLKNDGLATYMCAECGDKVERTVSRLYEAEPEEEVVVTAVMEGEINTVKMDAVVENGTAKVDDITTYMFERAFEKVVKVPQNEDGTQNGDGNTAEGSDVTTGDNSDTGAASSENKYPENPSNPDNTISLDFSDAEVKVNGVEFTKGTVEALSEFLNDDSNEAEYLSIKLPDKEIILDRKVAETIAKNMSGDSIRLVVDDTSTENLNDMQQEALAEKDVIASVDAYFVCNGKELHDFEGGEAVVSMDVALDSKTDKTHIFVYYIDNEGNFEEMVTWIEDGIIYFKTTHFSDYVIIYDENKTNATKKSVKAPYLKMSKTIGLGNKFALNVTNVSERARVTYTSSDESVATVDDNGVITAVGKGKCTIVGVIKQKGTAYKFAIAVTVKKTNRGNRQMKEKECLTPDSVTPLLNIYKAVSTKKPFALNIKRLAEDAAVTYTSEDESIATVSEDGVITGLRKGYTGINVNIQQNGKSYQYRIYVRVSTAK